MTEKITMEEQREIEELIRDEIAVRVRQFGDNEYLAADEIIRYLESIGYTAKEYTPTCDLCGEQWEDGGEGEDWNGETGNHKSCEDEARLAGSSHA